MSERKVEVSDENASTTRTVFSEERDSQRITFGFIWIKGREGYDAALARGHASMDYILARPPAARLLEYPGYVSPITPPVVREMTATDLGLAEESPANG